MKHWICSNIYWNVFYGSFLVFLLLPSMDDRGRLSMGLVNPKFSRKTLTKKNYFNHWNPVLGLEWSLFRGVMTSHGKIRNSSETARPLSILTTRSTINIGRWNVWPTYWTGMISQIVAEMRRYNLIVLGISETHWTKFDQGWLA